MKSLAGAIALGAAVLIAGSALARALPGAVPRPTAPPAVPQQDARAGISVMVQRLPSAAARTVGQSGRNGAFSGRIRIEAGDHRFTAVCPPRRVCSDLRLSGVTVDGRQIVPDARGEIVFSVRATADVEVRAQVECCIEIIHHDGITTRSGARPGGGAKAGRLDPRRWDRPMSRSSDGARTSADPGRA